MEEKLMDKVISDALKEDIVLPDIINLKVDKALDNIINGKKDEKKKRIFNNRFLKAAIIALAIVGVGAIGIRGENIVSYAKMFVDSVFRTMKNDRGINENFDKYSNKIVAEATDNDITIRVTDVFSDGVTLKLGYTVTDKKFKERGKYYSGSIWDNSIYIDGEEALFSNGWSNDDKVDDNTLMVVESHKFEKRLPAKFNVNWKISNVCEVKGNWELNFEVNSEGLAKDSKIIDVNKDYKIGECVYHLKDIIYTPTGNYIDIKATAPAGYDFGGKGDNKTKTLIITDENGVIIQYTSGLTSEPKEDHVEIEYELGAVIDKMPKEYNIIPILMDGGEYNANKGKKLDISKMEKITVKVQE